MSRDPKFRRHEKVRITRGFYRGYTGRVVAWVDGSYYTRVSLGWFDCELHWLPEEYLEAANAPQ